MATLTRIIQITLISIGAVLLVGCSSSTQDGPYFYQLPFTVVQQNELKSTVAQKNQPIIWVEPIVLSSQLGARNIAYQTSDVNYTLAQNNLWASALDEQLVLGLENILSARLPEYFVSRQANSQADYRLQVSITEFHPRYDGKVVMAGRFTITAKSGKIFSQAFKQEATLQQDGYDETVRQLAALWQAQIDVMVEEIRALN